MHIVFLILWGKWEATLAWNLNSNYYNVIFNAYSVLNFMREMRSNFGMKFAIQIQFWVTTKAILSSKLQYEPEYFRHWILTFLFLLHSHAVYFSEFHSLRVYSIVDFDCFWDFANLSTQIFNFVYIKFFISSTSYATYEF